LAYGIEEGTSLEPFIDSSQPTDMNVGPSITQSTQLDATSSIDAASDATPQPVRIINGNMPQPPTSSSRALITLSVPSYSNQDVDNITESEGNNGKNEQRIISPKEKTLDENELDNENDYSNNVLLMKRQSARIRSSKRINPVFLTDPSARKKKKK